MLSRNCKDSISLGWVCRLEELASVAVRLSEKGIEFVGQFWCVRAGRFSEHKKAFIITNRKKYIRPERAYGLCGSGNTDSVSMRVGLITRRVTTSDAWR